MMNRWKLRHLDRYSGYIALVALAGLFVLVAQSSAEGLPPAEFLGVLSAWGFAEELIFTAVGLIVLAFLAGRGKDKAVMVAGIALILLANSTMAGPANLLTTFPTDLGTDRPTLLELAEKSPNPTIVDQIPVVLRLGEVLGTARLVTPPSMPGFGYRLRALTEIDVSFEETPPRPSRDELVALGEEQMVGMLVTTPVSVIGEGVEYIMLGGPDGVFIVASDLLEPTS